MHEAGKEVLMSRKTLVVSCLFLFLSTTTALACLWDSDTLQMERLRFPGVLEIITGKFVRHSRAYYEWRIGDRTKKLETNPGDPALIDDLAVAYAKLGRSDEGIPLLEEVLKQHPDRYETLSNLGTLLFFAGRLDDSKTYIRRAVEINPNAHFGRERYQLLLTEYLQQSEHETEGVISVKKPYPVMNPRGFARFVLNSKLPADSGNESAENLSPQQIDELRKSLRGVLGMMHFADYRSPILLVALGDLLLTGNLDENATMLAARSYVRAAQVTPDPAVAERFRKMAGERLATQIDFHSLREGEALPYLEKKLNAEIAVADEWFTAIAANEDRWIAEGRNVDAEFSSKYYDSLERTIDDATAQIAREPKEIRLTRRQSERRVIVLAGVVCIGGPFAFVAVVGAFVWRYRVTQRRRTSQ
jgi:tetratricopeptide (TPR) repeat protein